MDEDYRKRLEAHRKSEEFRSQLAETDQPYDPGEMESRVPLGCTLATIVGILAIVFCMAAWLRRCVGG